MTIDLLSVADCRIAYQRQLGNKNIPGVIFLSGFASDMQGVKASFLARQCVNHNISYVRFDYRGCGRSEGKFTDATIGLWLDDALAVLDRLTEGPQIVVGSSMGGWLGLLLSKRRPERFRAFVGVATAPDFSEDLIWEKMDPSERDAIRRDGFFFEKNQPADHAPPITLRFIDDARNHLVLRTPLKLPFPVRLLQGMNDADVPWQTGLRLAEHIACNDLYLTLVKNGDHSLSEPQHLDLLWKTISVFLT